MIESKSGSSVSGTERFDRTDVSATPEIAARTRDEFAGWLQRSFRLDAERTSDVVLAINEALANSAEYAYAGVGGFGTMDVHAWHEDGTISVVVADRGVWRSTDTLAETRSRGRGIPLMRALSDRTSIETSADGTRVLMAWSNVDPR